MYGNADNEEEENDDQNSRSLLAVRRTNQDPLQAPIYLSSNDLSSLAGIVKDELYATDVNVQRSINSVEEDETPADELAGLEKRKDPPPSGNTGDAPVSERDDDDDDNNNQSSDLDAGVFLPLAAVERKTAEQQLARRLQQILSSVKETRPFYDPVASIMRLDSEGDGFNLPLPGNIYTNSKFERQERLDVKKPGPWFNVNNFAFESATEDGAGDGDDDDTAEMDAELWGRSSPVLIDEDYFFDVVEDVPTNRDFRKNQLTTAGIKSANRNRLAVLLQKMNDEQGGEDLFKNSRKTAAVDDDAVEVPALMPSNGDESLLSSKVCYRMLLLSFYEIR